MAKTFESSSYQFIYSLNEVFINTFGNILYKDVKTFSAISTPQRLSEWKKNLWAPDRYIGYKLSYKISSNFSGALKGAKDKDSKWRDLIKNLNEEFSGNQRFDSETKLDQLFSPQNIYTHMDLLICYDSLRKKKMQEIESENTYGLKVPIKEETIAQKKAKLDNWIGENIHMQDLLFYEQKHPVYLKGF